MAWQRNGVTTGVFDRRQIAKAAVRPNRVVVQPPNGERLADMAERGEQPRPSPPFLNLRPSFQRDGQKRAKSIKRVPRRFICLD